MGGRDSGRAGSRSRGSGGGGEVSSGGSKTSGGEEGGGCVEGFVPADCVVDLILFEGRNEKIRKSASVDRRAK